MFYLSEELSSKISESKKSFHKGNDIFTNLLDKFFESCSDYNFGGHFNLYNSAFLDECNLGMVKELPPDFRKPLRYFACFGISLLRNTIEVQKGILFKRMVKKDEWKWKFSGISLEFLKKLEALCNESNIKILGAEIVFFNKSISEYTPQVHTMENLYDSYVCKDPMGASNRATFLKWRYSTNG